jgi:hypothetical protein
VSTSRPANRGVLDIITTDLDDPKRHAKVFGIERRPD